MKVDCSYPIVRFIAFEARNPKMVFIADPHSRGRYVYTDRAAALVACPLCKSIPCEPCKSKNNYVAYTHHMRRSAATRKLRGGAPSEDVLKPRLKLKLGKKAIEAFAREWDTGTEPTSEAAAE